MKVSLISAPSHPVGTLFYIWRQSRSNKPLPSPRQIEQLLKYPNASAQYDSDIFEPEHYEAIEMLGFKRGQSQDCAASIRAEVEMILAESIPVVENLNFVFHLQGIPISLREQLVRHRLGTKLDPRVGIDIIPEPIQGLLADGDLQHMDQVPNFHDSSWWAQTSRVVPFDTFYDEGRYIVPESLKGKQVQIAHHPGCEPLTIDAEEYYRNTMASLQEAYRALQKAGVHIEDCRQLVPVGATGDITWSVNLAAMIHILGKRSSWVSQAGLWEPVIMGMRKCLVEVDPLFAVVGLPKCIKKGKYVGCPVAGTNVERIQGTDGMPPCPLWVRYETQAAIEAAESGVDIAWKPPMEEIFEDEPDSLKAKDIRNWTPTRPVEAEMLDRNAAKFSEVWGFDAMNGLPGDQS